MFKTRVRVRTRFCHFVRRRLESRSLAVIPACERLFDEMISVGVTRLEQKGWLEREDQLVSCEHCLHEWVQEIHDHVISQGTFPIVDVDTFQAMHFRMCPLWPFC